jgi:arsenite methyltransferase
VAATCPSSFDVASLRARVRETYARLAASPDGDFHFHRGPDYAARLLGYDARELAGLPAEATSAFAGVGRPFAADEPRAGEVVLDHACGAGMDLLLAARRVGPTGRAIGVDLTPAMVHRARRAAELAGVAASTEILQGAYEALPVESASVDLVISNGVLNLAPDKRVVLQEIVRVLKPGGRLALADVVVQRELTLAARRDPELWAACVAGALPESELGELARETGLIDVRIVGRFDCFAGTSAERKTSRDLQIGAVAVFARRPTTEVSS